MRSSQHIKALQKVVEVRRLQRAAAESRATRAEHDRRELDDRRREGMSAIELEQAHWTQALEGDSLSLSLAGAWAAEIHLKERRLALLNDEYRRADAIAEQARRAWYAAIGAEDSARSKARTADQRAIRRREEAQMEETSDRFTLVSVTS